MVIGPLVIWSIRRLISWWFTRLTSSNAEYINALRSEQQEKIEDLKQSTNFYSTKALLERFDSSFDNPNRNKTIAKVKGSVPVPAPASAPGAGSGSGFGPRPGPKPEFKSETNLSLNQGPEQKPAQFKPAHRTTSSIAADDFEFAPFLPSLQSSKPAEALIDRPQSPQSSQSPETLPQPSMVHLQQQQQQQQLQQQQNQSSELQNYPLGPVYKANYQPSWYDKILDIIVGEDEYSPKSRYALICGNCRRHNGLAQPGELPQYVIYICPQCGFRNGQEKKKRKESKPVSSSSIEENQPPLVEHTQHQHHRSQPTSKTKHLFTQLESESAGDADVEDSSVVPPFAEGSEYASNDESSGVEEKVQMLDKKSEPKKRPGLHQRKKSRKGR